MFMSALCYFSIRGILSYTHITESQPQKMIEKTVREKKERLKKNDKYFRLEGPKPYQAVCPLAFWSRCEIEC